jgi:cobalt-zinc-cadmium efflux system outer membrane protein
MHQHPDLHKKLTAVLLFFFVQAVLVPSDKAIAESRDLPGMSRDSRVSDENARTLVSPERTLSLRASFQRAYENNKEIIAAEANLPIAKAAVKIAGAIPNPRFGLQYGFGPQFKLILAGEPQQFGWQQDIQTAGKRTKQLNLARANYRLTELQVAQLMFDVRNRVRRAYAEQAAAEAYAELVESERNVALNLVRVAERRFEAGKAARSEILQAQLGVLQFDTQRNQAQARLQQATAALALIIGETPKHVEVIDVDDNGIFKLSAEKTDLVPSPDRPLPSLEQLLPVAYQKRPDLKVSVQQAFSDRRALSLAKAQRIPDIFVDSGYQFTTFTPVQPFHLTPVIVPNSPGCYLNVAAELPIFYQRQGEVSQAKATWLQDFDQINQLKWQVGTDAVTAYESARVARANIATFQGKLIPQAAEVARLARRRYEVGKGDLASAILAKQQYQQILSSYFDAVVAYQNAWADLEKAMGVPLQL